MNRNRLLSIGLPVLTLCALVSAGVYGILQIRTKVSQSSRVDVLVASRDLWAEERIKDPDLQVVRLQFNASGPKCFADKSLVLGHKVIVPLAKGDVICSHNMAIENEENFTWPDMRAVSVPMSEIVASTDLVQRGAHVDVLLSWDLRGRREHPTTVLKNICVIARQERQEPEHNSVGLHQMPSVFLLLSPDDAQKLARVQRHGKIRLSILHGISSCM